MVMAHTHAKGKGERSVGSKDREETNEYRMDGQMDGTDCIIFCANMVSKYQYKY